MGGSEAERHTGGKAGVRDPGEVDRIVQLCARIEVVAPPLRLMA
jgi:hypothetical protein